MPLPKQSFFNSPRDRRAIDVPSPWLQTKLTIGVPDDAYEREVHRVADQVMAMPVRKLQRQSESEDEEETLQAKPLADRHHGESSAS